MAHPQFPIRLSALDGSLMPFRFRNPRIDDAEMLLDWRTRPEITRYMFTDLDPDLERQRNWLRACETREDFVHFVIEWQDRPVGYLSFAEIDRVHRRCTPGTYLLLEPKQRYIAAFTHSFVLDYAFYRLGMHKICYSIMGGNDNFIRAKAMMGVRSVGVLREHIFKYGSFHDVHLFEITEAEWAGQRHLFSRDKTLAAFPS
jgi:RimJ/RimL family protein N-acetyltransferase